MRVLVVATQIRLPDTHGGSTHVGELVAGLRKHGPVQVLTKRGSTAPDTVPVSFNVGFPAVIKHIMPRLYFPQSLAAARAFKPDVIYERASSYGLGALLSKALGVPMLAMVLDEHYAQTTLKQAKYVVATDEAVVPAAYRDKYVKVSWGANAERFTPDLDKAAARARWGLPAERAGCVVCYVGSFKGWHGLEGLVEAATEAGPGFHYLLIGDGPGREAIETAVTAAGLSARFVFTGALAYDDVPAVIAAADMCVAPFDPSLHPRSAAGFVLDPLKIFEYLAMAKPSITINSDNISRLFDDGKDLLLVDPSDPAGLVRAMMRFRDDPTFAAATAQSGRAKVLVKHTWQAHADHLYELFGTMVSGATA